MYKVTWPATETTCFFKWFKTRTEAMLFASIKQNSQVSHG